MRLLIILGFLITINCTIAFAQEPGYVVKDNNDTIACSIKTAGVGGYQWKIDTEDGWKNFAGMKAFHLNQTNITYEKKVLPDKSKVFLKVLEQGKINLYEYLEVYPGIISSDVIKRWYICKGKKAQVTEIKSNHAINAKAGNKPNPEELFKLLADQPAALKVLKKTDYTFEAIRSSVHIYNTGKPLPAYTEEPEEEN